MKVYIICKEPFPYGMAGTQRIICYAKSMIAEGLECEVLVYARGEKGKVRRNIFPRGVYEGIPFRYVGGSTRKPSHRIARIICESYDKIALRIYLSRNLSAGDVVIAYVNSDTDYLCDIIDLVHSKGAKYVRELNEIPFFGGESKEDKEGLKKILDTLFPKCDGFITISETLYEVAQKHKREDAEIVKIPILVDFEKSVHSADCNDVQTPYIFHSGTLYEQKDGILGMLAAFGKARAELDFPVRMVMTGHLEESPDKNRIQDTINKYNLSECIEFVGYCKEEEVHKRLAGSAFAVINKHDNIQNKYGFSTKLATYLSAGKAIIMTDVGEAMNWLEEDKTAWIVPREDTEALSDAIVKAFKNPQECKRIGDNGRELCRRCFDWRSVSKELTGFLSKLT